MGVATSLANPKSGAFWTSVFASMFPTDAPALMIATIHDHTRLTTIVSLSSVYGDNLGYSYLASWKMIPNVRR
jgi:threonine/homoserine/homoserine lactone efflux protein